MAPTSRRGFLQGMVALSLIPSLRTVPALVWKVRGAEAVLQVRATYVREDGRAERSGSRPRPHLRAAGPGRLRP
jgi:hypothetical protein